MGVAIKQTVKDVGYVVFWKEGYDFVPLKCFGEYQSAAIEFCHFLNSDKMDKDRLNRQIKIWAKSFDPAVKYSYPILKNGFIELKKQRTKTD